MGYIQLHSDKFKLHSFTCRLVYFINNRKMKDVHEESVTETFVVQIKSAIVALRNTIKTQDSKTIFNYIIGIFFLK